MQPPSCKTVNAPISTLIKVMCSIIIVHKDNSAQALIYTMDSKQLKTVKKCVGVVIRYCLIHTQRVKMKVKVNLLRKTSCCASICTSCIYTHTSAPPMIMIFCCRCIRHILLSTCVCVVCVCSYSSGDRQGESGSITRTRVLAARHMASHWRCSARIAARRCA